MAPSGGLTNPTNHRVTVARLLGTRTGKMFPNRRCVDLLAPLGIINMDQQGIRKRKLAVMVALAEKGKGH